MGIYSSKHCGNEVALRNCLSRTRVEDYLIVKRYVDNVTSIVNDLCQVGAKAFNEDNISWLMHCISNNPKFIVAESSINAILHVDDADVSTVQNILISQKSSDKSKFPKAALAYAAGTRNNTSSTSSPSFSTIRYYRCKKNVHVVNAVLHKWRR